MGINKNYAKLCEKGIRNFYTGVPEDRQPAVREIIEADGYVILDDGTCVKPVPNSEE